MIMAYTRMALACPRLGFKIQPQGLLQPGRQPVQVKPPSASSSTRHFLQTAQRLCNCPGNDKKPKEGSKDDKLKLEEIAQGKNDKSKKCSAFGTSAEDNKKPEEGSKDDAKKPEVSGQGKSKKNSEAEKNNAKQCAHGGKDQSNENPTKSGDTPIEGAEGNNNKSKGKSMQCAKADSEKSQGSTMDSNDNDKEKVEECSEGDASESEDNMDASEFSEDSEDSIDDECDESKECVSSLKMPGCEDPASMCPDPCDDDEESDEIAAHVGGMCSKDPCGKLKEPCEGFMKKHIGSLLRHQEKEHQKLVKTKPITH